MLHDIHILGAPVSIILAAVFIIAVVLCGMRLTKIRLLAVLAGREFSIIILISAALLCAIEGTWKLNMFRTWGFLAIVLLLMFSLGLVTVDAIRKKLSASYILSHLGLLTMLFGGFFGAPDVTDAMLVAVKDQAATVACTKDGHAAPLPFKTTLKDFTIDYYEDGQSPRQFTSTLVIDGKELTTSVNHPLHRKGYRLYQSDYDRDEGRYSVLKVVRNPWLPIVFLGMAFLALAAILGLKGTWKSKLVIPVMLGLAVVFTLISLAKINFGTLMPALRSLWFVPHLIIYMLAYSLLAISLIAGIFALCGKQGAAELSGRLLHTASALLIIGMLCGAVWAQTAWGDWWTWDAKECWAAVTWLLTLVGTHLLRKNCKAVFVAILLSFAAMQVTWYGVNYLPSAEGSLHTYNQSR